MPEPGASRRKPAATLLLASVLLAAGTAVHYQWGYFGRCLPCHSAGLDDAYISFRYAENLLMGHGLVYNPGRFVEGYSNLLYTLLMTPLLAAGGKDSIYLLATLLNTGFMLGAAWMLFGLARRRLGHGWAVLTTLLFTLLPVNWLWTASGMETSLVVLLQVAHWSLAPRVAQEPRPTLTWALAAAMVLSVAVRADGILTPVVAIAYLACMSRRKLAWRYGALTTAALAAHVLWRLGTYGSFLPNTYHAKVSATLYQRVTHAGDLFLTIMGTSGMGLYLLALLVLSAWAWTRLGARRSTAREIPYEALYCTMWLAYWGYIGGDHFDERFLLVLASMGLVTVLDWLRRTRVQTAGTVAAAAALLLVQCTPFLLDKRFSYGTEKTDMWTVLGRHLRQAHPDARLAIDAAGKVPFFSGLRTLDMLGLNDARISRLPATTFSPGHNKQDPGYVVSWEPDLIATWMKQGGDLSYGLTRSLYEAAGYRPLYLIGPFPGQEIRSVGHLDDAGMEALRAQGYNYAVLARETPSP